MTKGAICKYIRLIDKTVWIDVNLKLVLYIALFILMKEDHQGDLVFWIAKLSHTLKFYTLFSHLIICN